MPDRPFVKVESLTVKHNDDARSLLLGRGSDDKCPIISFVEVGLLTVKQNEDA